MVVSRTAVEPNAAFAGVTLEVSFARLRVSMATFSEEMIPSCPSGRWDSVAMVELKVTAGKRCEVQVVRKNSIPNGDRRPSCHRVLRVSRLLITVALTMCAIRQLITQNLCSLLRLSRKIP